MEEKYIDLVSSVADILQIGTRNMQNFPFLIECAKTKKPILLKRHFGCSLRDWLAAAEYIMYYGNEQVILCERGVSVPHTHRSTSRFLLDLQVIPAAKEITHLPIISDPSHATFWSPWVESMTLANIAAGADGIMLEVHPDQNSLLIHYNQLILKNLKLLQKNGLVSRSINKEFFKMLQSLVSNKLSIKNENIA